MAQTLQNAVRSGRVHHAYLFCGSRGIGKTSMARILASALNCAEGPTDHPCGECESCRRIARGDDMDVMEIDGASNRGIDEVRELRQNVKYSPSHSRYKIYYVDEVHMLTHQAFNALLKTLEEPPEHVKFIFSTTDPQQLPDTVKSRCQRFDFRRISDAEIVKHLRKICEQEDLNPETGAMRAIARAARGSMRDAVGTLDQVASFGSDTLELDHVLTVLGAARTETLTEIVDALAAREAGGALQKVHEVLFGGIDLLDFIDQLSEYLRDLLVAGYCSPDDELLAGALADPETLGRQGGDFTPEQLIYMIQVLREAKLRARRDTTGRLALELAIVKLSRLDDLSPIDDVLEFLQHMPENTAPSPRNRAGGEDQTPPSGQTPDSQKPRRDGQSTSTQSGRRDSQDQSTGQGNRARELMQKLSENSLGSKKKSVNNQKTVKDRRPSSPGNIDPKQFRKIQSVAENTSLAREAADNKALLNAFKEADARFGLDPVRLRREDTDDLTSAEQENSEAHTNSNPQGGE